MDNVIKFPKKNNRQVSLETNNVDEKKIKSNILEMKLNHINEALLIILPQLFSNIDMVGASASDFDPENIDDAKEINLIAESIRGILYKYYEIPHPFQHLADELFEYDEEKNVKIKRQFSINFTDKYGDDINIS